MSPTMAGLGQTANSKLMAPDTTKPLCGGDCLAK